MLTDRRIVIMAKAPVAGEVKTRLGAEIGMDRSAQFHEAFIADVCSTAASTGAVCTLSYAGDREHRGFDCARDLAFDFVEQPAGDLGAKLTFVVRREMGKSEKLIIVGSDSPTLLPRHFSAAFEALDAHDVVLGPSFDGGYYLIAVRPDHFEFETSDKLSIFAEIPWSTDAVLRETLECCEVFGHRCQLLDFWYDVDTRTDLEFMAGHVDGYLSRGAPEAALHTRELLKEFAKTER